MQELPNSTKPKSHLVTLPFSYHICQDTDHECNIQGPHVFKLQQSVFYELTWTTDAHLQI